MTRREARRWKQQRGRIWIEDETLCQESNWCGSWRVSIPEIRAVAEETNEYGPGGEDWLLAFFTGGDQWFNASTSAEGEHDTVIELAARLGCALERKLVGSTAFASRVIYPEHLKDEPAFEYRSLKRPGIGRLLDVFLAHNLQTIAPELKRHLSQ